MKKKTLLLLPLLLGVIPGCQGGDKITLFSDTSQLIGTPMPDKNNPNLPAPMLEEYIYKAPLKTYHHKDKGDVPYVEVGEFATAANTALVNIMQAGISAELKDDGYHLYGYQKKGELIFDAEHDIIKAKNTSAFYYPSMISNNGIEGDFCNYRQTSIADSDKTKRYMADGSELKEYYTYDLKDYHFDIVLQDKKCYVPSDVLSKIVFGDASFDVSYNGLDFFSNVTTRGFVTSWIYSSNTSFQGVSGIFRPSKQKGPNEAYRFEREAPRLKEGSQTEQEMYTAFLVLENGSMKTARHYLCKGTTLDTSQTYPDVESNYSYTWHEDDKYLYINVFEEGNPLGTYKVNKRESHFLKGQPSIEMSSFNYDLLRFIFDTKYGLKDIKNYKTAEDYFTSLQVNDGLKSRDSKTYNEALAKLMGAVDDGHSAYSNMALYTNYDALDAFNDNRIKNIGPRVKALQEKAKLYQAARVVKNRELYPDDANPEDPNFYQGIRFSSDNETAVITFDAFGNNVQTIPNMKEQYPDGIQIEKENRRIEVRSRFINSTTAGFNAAFKVLDDVNKESKVVKNVVFDITCNGGGEIATMPYLAAFFSADPTFALKSTYGNYITEYHYKVDINGDGVFGGEGDTYKDKFNFYFLTSGFSFSCGNCLPGMAKENGVKIIGERSGGGTSSVGVSYDALGSLLSISNHFQMLYKENGKYVHNDQGIPLDHQFAFDKGNWYDPNAINTFIKSLA